MLLLFFNLICFHLVAYFSRFKDKTLQVAPESIKKRIDPLFSITKDMKHLRLG